MKLNCDLGESYGNWSMGQDAAIMPFINQANIACGFHAGDPLTMTNTVKLAVDHGVSIGAHPAYPDLVGFGRRSMAMPADELRALIQYQIGALHAICQQHNTQVSYVKPHGALYNDMMASLPLFETICQALHGLTHSLPLILQALPDNSEFEAIANKYHITLWFEAFADRNYQDNGLLVPRKQLNAVISDPDIVKQRCEQLLSTGVITSENGHPLMLKVDTLCIHGDTDNALTLAQTLHPLFASR